MRNFLMVTEHKKQMIMRYVEFLMLTEHKRRDIHCIEIDHALTQFLLFSKIKHISSLSTVKRKKTLQVTGKCI